MRSSKKEEKMSLKFNEKEGIIEIKDSLETRHYILIFINVLNIFNAVIYWFNPVIKNSDFFRILWVLLGIASIIILIYLFTKKSVISKIPLELVQHLSERTLIGRKRFSLQLNNGKHRDLPYLKTKAEISAMKDFLSESGIQLK